MGKITSAIKSAFGLATEKHAAVQSELERLQGEHAALVQRAHEITALRDDAIDDATAWAAVSRDLEAAHLEAGRVQRLIDREQTRLRDAATALKREELAAATQASVVARDLLITRADALARARVALGTAISDYISAEHRADEQFQSTRALAAGLGDPAPAAAQRAASETAYSRLMLTMSELKVRPLQSDPFNRNILTLLDCPQTDIDMFACLIRTLSLPDAYAFLDRYGYAERVADLRSGGPEKYLARVAELSAADLERRTAHNRVLAAREKAAREEHTKALAEEYGMRFVDD